MCKSGGDNPQRNYFPSTSQFSVSLSQKLSVNYFDISGCNKQNVGMFQRCDYFEVRFVNS